MEKSSSKSKNNPKEIMEMNKCTSRNRGDCYELTAKDETSKYVDSDPSKFSKRIMETSPVQPSVDTHSNELENLYTEIQHSTGSLDKETLIRTTKYKRISNQEPGLHNPSPYTIDAVLRPRKLPFVVNEGENGNLISVHHTLQEDSKILRVPLTACGFSERGTTTQVVSVDRRGNIFVFDFLAKRYWHLTVLVSNAKVIVPTKQKPDEYLIGSKTGELFLVNVERSVVLRAVRVSTSAIECISFPGQDTQPAHLALIHASSEAVIVNLDTFVAIHRLEFNETRISLKYATYLPYSDQILTCFTNDALHLWSSVSLNTLNVTYPIKAMHRKLKQISDLTLVPTFKYKSGRSPSTFCNQQDFSKGLITAYSFTNHNGGLLCLATLEKYLLLLQLRTFELQQVYRMQDFIVKQCEFVVQANELLLLAMTDVGQVLLLDFSTPEFKLIVQVHAKKISISLDTKMLAILGDGGDLTVWSTKCLYNTLKSQQQCINLLKDAFKHPKPVEVGLSNEATFNDDIMRLLKRDRLLCILREYGCYPSKYRNLIWCSLLELPCNRSKFQQLLKLKTPCAILERVAKLRLKSEGMKRSLIKIWSCLAHWCKVFAYSDFFPNLIFPFVKLFPRNALITFEICTTLLLNHFQLWFEYHPLEPEDYLGMCMNVLQHFDPELCKFFQAHNITSKEYAWSLLSNAFSEVLDEEQWLILWDNILSSPLYFPIFIVAAYNMVQRDVILLLPNTETIAYFYHEQNPVDMPHLIEKAFKLMSKCPTEIQPDRYIGQFQALPKNVYPKFLRYPRQWIERQVNEEEILKRERNVIETRIREIEVEELKVMQRLEKKLKAEEHAKRTKEMERMYQETLQREEERLACHRKLLLLYQKELRNRKGEILANIKESERRKRSFEMERDMDTLLHKIDRERERNDIDLILAEDCLRDQDLELLETQHYAHEDEEIPLGDKYKENITKLNKDRELFRQGILEIIIPEQKDDEKHIEISDTQLKSKFYNSNISRLQASLDEIETEFLSLLEK